MRTLVAMVCFLTSTVVAQGADRTEAFVPKFQDRPFASGFPSDSRLPPAEAAALIQERARQLCEFYRKPAGNFRQRLMESVTTSPYFEGERPLAVMERQGNSYRARLVPARGDSTLWSVFTKVECVGR